MSENQAIVLERRFEELSQVKGTWNASWQNVVDYVLPKRQAFTGPRSDGQTVTDKIFDSTAPWALDQLAAGLHSYLTSPTQRWFRLRLTDYAEEEMEEDEEIERWLEIVTNTMYGIFNSQKTNFAPQAHELYQDLGGFGTGVFYVEEDYAQAPVRFSTFHLAECVFEENAYGVVDTLYRKFKMSHRQAYQRFGDRLPSKYIELAEKKPADKAEILHVVKPREEWDPRGMSAKNMPFASWWVLCEAKLVVQESGFREFPFMVPRWSKLTGETYGRGPAMLAMPDIKMVNAMAKTVLVAAQKVVDPPLMLPDEGFLLPIRTSPGGLNFYNSTLGPDQRIFPLETKGRVDIGQQLIDSRRQHITRSFYLDWMQLNEGPQMTATEVVQRTEERMRLMAPAISRLQSEFLDPLIERVYAICLRKQLFPPAPQSIQGQDLRVEYVSPVAKAQRMTQVVGFQRLLESLGQIAQAKPEVFDRIDADGTVDFLADAYDVSYQTLTPMEQVKQIRDDRASKQDQAGESEGMNQDSGTALNMAKALQAATQAGGMTDGAKGPAAKA
jgi:hypothetical protein